MSLGITLEFSDPAKLPALLTVGRGVRDPELRMVMGAGVRKNLILHFSKLDRERPNRLGGKRTHFWEQVMNSVHQPELDGGDGLKIGIAHVGAAQRYFGGTIRPKEKQWLTIPARTEAYGADARKFKDLHFVFFRRGLAALVQNEQTSLTIGRRRKDGSRKVSAGESTGGGVFYWLKKEVTQKPDKTVLPPESELAQAALTEGDAYAQILIDRANRQ
ncbi:hypothetical protein OpiT1DRAFT_03969 [Opitutaceae bacterium TAV1]|nr:hypothetical protein OpiT1DRAFT_03969 [Opitutaceae bacterium TAV1]